jgi:hypothetical protein
VSRRASIVVPICFTAVLLGAIPSGSAGGTKWTEFGATEKAWRAPHTADPDPKLIDGCCFLTRLRNGLDRYYEVQYEKSGGVSRVFNFSMRFQPALSLAAARAVVRREAPPQSKLAFSVKRSEWVQIGY